MALSGRPKVPAEGSVPDRIVRTYWLELESSLFWKVGITKRGRQTDISSFTYQPVRMSNLNKLAVEGKRVNIVRCEGTGEYVDLPER